MFNKTKGIDILMGRKRDNIRIEKHQLLAQTTMLVHGGPHTSPIYLLINLV